MGLILAGIKFGEFGGKIRQIKSPPKFKKITIRQIKSSPN